MDLLKAAFEASAWDGGRYLSLGLSLTGKAGDSIYIQGTPRQCDLLFRILCGFERPERGTVEVCGQNLYALPQKEAAQFRREHFGAIPSDGGWIPEQRMAEQIVFPLKLAGWTEADIQHRLKALAFPILPLDTLKNRPGEIHPRKAALAAVLRAAVHHPEVLLVNRYFEEFDEIDRELLWKAVQEARGENSVFVCLGCGPETDFIPWTKVIHL